MLKWTKKRRKRKGSNRNKKKKRRRKKVRIRRKLIKKLTKNRHKIKRMKKWL